MKTFKKIMARLILFMVSFGLFLIVNCRSDGDSNSWLIVSFIETICVWILVYVVYWAFNNINGGE